MVHRRCFPPPFLTSHPQNTFRSEERRPFSFPAEINSQGKKKTSLTFGRGAFLERVSELAALSEPSKKVLSPPVTDDARLAKFFEIEADPVHCQKPRTAFLPSTAKDTLPHFK